jgi:hypothetical protein
MAVTPRGFKRVTSDAWEPARRLDWREIAASDIAR